jgi:hypothetical protein
MEDVAATSNADRVRAMTRSESDANNCIWRTGGSYSEGLLDQLGTSQLWSIGAELAESMNGGACDQHSGTGDWT